MTAFRPARRVLVAALAGSLAVSLAACAPGGSTPESTFDPDAPVTLTWWDYYADDSGPALAVTELLDAYQEEFPNVTIEREFIAYADLKKSLLQSAGASALPDVAIVNGPDHQQFAELGIAADLTDRLEAWGELDQYPQGLIDSATLDGRIYGLPITANCLALFYNIDLFEQAGIEPPTSWDDLSDAAAELTADGTYGFAFSAINNQQAVFQWLPTLWQSGGDLTDLDSPEAVEALEFWASFVAEGSASREVLNWDQATVASEFAQGRAAMMINGPWQLPYLAAEAPDLDYGVALLPAGEEEASVTGGENYLVTEGPNADAAWNLVQWMQDPSRIERIGEGSGSLPTRDGVEPASDDPRIEVFAEQLQVARPRAYGANYAEIADLVVVALQSVLSGSSTAEDALATAAAAIEPLLP